MLGASRARALSERDETMLDPLAATSPVTTRPLSPNRRFGTFLGVFTPSVLTILGVMMYLRFGWVVGNAGLARALVIVLASSTITLITALSASAIATNMRIGVGGEYYMVSRSLGLELGGAIGIPLFLCRTLSLTLYAFGLAESVAFLWPPTWGPAPIQGGAIAVIVLTTAVAGRSAETSLRLQVPIMIAVGLSVVALLVGVLAGELRTPELGPHYERSAPGGFWYVFAVFFPAVTGFAAGIGMSGDLRDPKGSIPRGTLLAVVTGAVVYIAVMILLAVSGATNGEELADLEHHAPTIWVELAWMGPWLVLPGMWGAILSSAFGSALAGPRVLQALASDGLAPSALARTSRSGQPTLATWTTGGIAAAAVLLGDLNAVGRWVTIFFLTLYVTINLAAGLESLARDVYYRPTLRVPWYLSLAGSAATIVVMFLISRIACAAAITMELLLYVHLRRRAFRSAWGDVRAGLWTALARFSLLQLRELQQAARNWRPHILLFTANPENRMGLVRLADWFNQRRGVVTVTQLVQGHLGEDGVDIDTRLAALEARFAREGVIAFSEVVVVPELGQGILTVAQAHGIAGLQSNTLMFGWPTDPKGMIALLVTMRAVARVRKSVVVARLAHADGPLRRSSIDVWWRGREQNGDMMILLAHLLKLNAEWRTAVIVVRTIVDSAAEEAIMRPRLSELVLDARIPARTDVIVAPPNRPVVSIMHEASQNADLVFLGLRIPTPAEDEAYAAQLMAAAAGFRSTVFVRNSSPFRGKLL